MLPSLRDARSASEYPKALSSWLELDYFRRRGPLRTVRGLVGWTTLLASAAIVAVCAVMPGRREIYQAAPVSTAHALFNDDCESCHNVRFATATRLLRGDDAVRSVGDGACLRCHSGETHHPGQAGAAGCATCHREHRGPDALARVGDGHCTSCHADLERHTDMSKRTGDADRLYRDVASFLGGPRPHPPFALTEKPDDPGTIRFNHRVHVDPKGVLVPGSLGRKALGCADCHQAGEDGRSMEPISYRKHCRDCHPLSVRVFGGLEDPPARLEADRYRADPAPHPEAGEGPELVRAVLRDRYLRFARRFPSVYEKGAQAERRPPVPGRRIVAAAPPVRVESEWAERQLAQAERLLFEGAGGCRYCHRPAAGSPSATADGLPRWEPSQIRTRWLPHSVFSHDRHRSLDCLQCHSGAGESRSAGDVLMPAIESCRQCHTGAGRGARSDCVECHAYHPAGAARDAPRNLSIDDFLHGLDNSPGARRSAPGAARGGR